MPFTLNAIVLAPLLQSLPISMAISVLVTVVVMLRLDGGVLGLGRPETAADVLVAWMMAFSAAAPACWVGYMALNTWKWAMGFINRQPPRP